MNRIAIAAAVIVGAPATAHAFCGFYVAGNDQKLFNDATEVVLMREGTRTVLSMQNNYKGPPEAFAMVIPVPTVLHEGDVKTLPKDVFDRVDKMGAPRLVEYWEQDPCQVDRAYDRPRKMAMHAAGGAPPAPAAEKADLGVTIEAKFAVGEYQIVILSAKDSTGLDTWLHQEKYQIPTGAEPLLRPYVEAGMKWFVAKVDPKKVQLPNLVAQDVPEINVKQGEPLPGGAGFTNRPQGCGCAAATDVGSAAGGSLLALLTIVALRRRRN